MRRCFRTALLAVLLLAAPAAVIYVGPGVWHDPQTNRIHVRLSHLHLKSFGKDNYRGETDPRKLPLVIAARDSQIPVIWSSDFT